MNELRPVSQSSGSAADRSCSFAGYSRIVVFAGNYREAVKQQRELRRMHGTGGYTITDLAELHASTL
ncbi:hypothetical protein JF770_21000 [Mycobacterium intracellulare]|uniref:hypothetical protein n=1 Tax=Mycobacterium intracellulare TaxID=1767 RepID=UPI001CDA1EF0|nr:hypothetical protein [Mycobacterium intracellulare]MCA2306047.1 hypothetical protein [Mycobacterium intracellulare]MCA2348274.1 hypothetical protein [Mycobacterium intracellulare]